MLYRSGTRHSCAATASSYDRISSVIAPPRPTSRGDDTDGVAELRASDADRERTVAALRHHASVGRLSLEELDARSEQAYAAATLSDLAALQSDLPALASRPRRRHHGSPGPGWRSFTARWHSPGGAEPPRAELTPPPAPQAPGRGFARTQRPGRRAAFGAPPPAGLDM